MICQESKSDTPPAKAAKVAKAATDPRRFGLSINWHTIEPARLGLAAEKPEPMRARRAIRSHGRTSWGAMMDEREAREARQALFNDLESGRTTPEAADDRARALGLEALTPSLDAAHFDPMSETYWTLAMAVAWIAWADLERVRECMPNWREKHLSWFWREYVDANAESGAQVRSGWFLERTHKGEAPLLYLSLCEASKAGEGAPPDLPQRHTVHEAKKQLWERLSSGEITATTLFNGAPHAIPAHEWTHLQADEHLERDALYLSHDAYLGPRYVSDVLLPRAGVLRLWPAQAPPSPAINRIPRRLRAKPAEAAKSTTAPAPQAERPRRKTKPEQVAEIARVLRIDPNMPEGQRINIVHDHFKSRNLTPPGRTSIQEGLRLAGCLNARKGGKPSS